MEEERVVPAEKGRLLAEQLGMYMTRVCTCAGVHMLMRVGQTGHECVCIYDTGVVVNYVPV